MTLQSIALTVLAGGLAVLGFLVLALLGVALVRLLRSPTFGLLLSADGRRHYRAARRFAARARRQHAGGARLELFGTDAWGNLTALFRTEGARPAAERDAALLAAAEMTGGSGSWGLRSHKLRGRSYMSVRIG